MKVLFVAFVLVLFGYSAANARELFMKATADLAWVASIKYLPRDKPRNEANNVFIVGMGRHLPFKDIDTPPFWGIIAAEKDPKTAEGDPAPQPDDVNLAALFFVYTHIGEYCEKNGKQGFQPWDGDLILRAASWEGATWSPISAIDDRANSKMVYANMSSANGLFTLACRASGSDEFWMDGDIEVGPYEAKCDIIIDTSQVRNLTVPTSICTDDKRFVALVGYVAGAKVDNVQGDITSGNLTVDDDGALFNWKKQVQNLNNLNNYSVHTQIRDVTDKVRDLFPNALPTAVGAMKQVIYSFLTSKADGEGLLLWDPILGVNPNLLSPASVNGAGLSIFIIVAILFGRLFFF